jgi:hypothetical protein
MPNINIELKNIKTFRGRGNGFEADVYVDGKKVAHATDYGDGGPMNFMPIYDKEAFARAEKEAKNLPAPAGQSFDGLEMDLEYYVILMLSEWEFARWAKRACKKKTVYHFAGNRTDIYSYNIPFDEKIKAQILKKHPDAIILNEIYG